MRSGEAHGVFCQFSNHPDGGIANHVSHPTAVVEEGTAMVADVAGMWRECVTSNLKVRSAASRAT